MNSQIQNDLVFLNVLNAIRDTDTSIEFMSTHELMSYSQYVAREIERIEEDIEDTNE